jgi:small-conductance mechanosensitive channel
MAEEHKPEQPAAPQPTVVVVQQAAPAPEPKKDEKKDAYEFSIAGFKLKLNSKLLAMAIPVATTLGGAAWGAFEFYQDYLNMKKKIAAYVAPDLTEFNKRLAVIEETSAKNMKAIEESSSQTAEYTKDIKNDLKGDIRRLEGVVESVERDSKSNQRETDKAVQDARKDMRETKSDIDKLARQMEKDNAQQNKELQRYVEGEVKSVRKELDDKIKKALDNPLANK